MIQGKIRLVTSYSAFLVGVGQPPHLNRAPNRREVHLIDKRVPELLFLIMGAGGSEFGEGEGEGELQCRLVEVTGEGGC
jgi:hypothetical protein